MSKKGTLKIKKSKIAILVLNQCSISAVFQIVRLPGDQKTALTGDSLYLKDVKMIVHFLGHALLYCAPHFHKCGHIIATCHTYMPECGASIRWNKYVSRFDTTLHTLHIQGTYSQSFLVPFSESTVWENFEEKKIVKAKHHGNENASWPFQET